MKYLVSILLLIGFTLTEAFAEIEINSSARSPIVRPGEKLSFLIKDSDTPYETLRYRVIYNTQKIIGSGSISIINGQAQLEIRAGDSGSYFLVVTKQQFSNEYVGNPSIGWMVNPDKIKPSLKAPKDFTAFWDSVKVELDKLPLNAKIEKIEETDSLCLYTFRINAGGGKIGTSDGCEALGYFACPKLVKKAPVLLITYGAGSFKAEKQDAIRYAKMGIICFSLNPHPLLSDQPDKFYDALKNGVLKDYRYIGRDNKTQSYFLGMIKRCYQTARYITTLKDWDGIHFMTQGFSQGGAQALITAYLSPAVNGIAALCPALCDHAGFLSDHLPGWPQWIAIDTAANGGIVSYDRKQLNTSQYFDLVNFAGYIKKPVLIGLGLIDFAAPPCAVFTMYNQLNAPKKIVIMPQTGHGENKEHRDELNTFQKKILDL